MNIFVSQMYLKANINYPFSVEFQEFIHRELSLRVLPSRHYLSNYGDEFVLIFTLSADSELNAPKIMGPKVSRKYKEIDYSIFLTFDADSPQGPLTYNHALQELFASIIQVLHEFKIDTTKIHQDQEELIQRILSDPQMFDAVTN